jgi:uncharacterized membrane protein
MSTDRGRNESPDSGSTLPTDIGAALVFTVLTVIVATVPVLRETPLRIGMGLAFALLVPGYLSVAALFPRASEGDGDSATGPHGLDALERIVLSFGLSIAVVPLVGLALSFTPWGIRLVPVLVALTAFVVGVATVAVVRRRRLPREDRFVVRPRTWVRTVRTGLFEPATRSDAALNALVICAILLATGSVAFAVAAPTGGESFTTFSLLTENESGALVADDYPTEFVRGEPEPVVVSVSNHEGEPVRYTVVAELQRVRTEGNATQVAASTELVRFSNRVEANGTWRRTVDIAPERTGDRFRLQFLLYRGDAPADPSSGTAYRELHIWIDVASTAGSADATVATGRSVGETPFYVDQ